MRRIRILISKTPVLCVRATVAWRACLATVGNYGLCALVAAATGRLLPRLGVARIEAAVLGELLAIILLPVTPLFVFAARSSWRPTLVIGGAIAGLAMAVSLAAPP